MADYPNPEPEDRLSQNANPDKLSKQTRRTGLYNGDANNNDSIYNFKKSTLGPVQRTKYDEKGNPVEIHSIGWDDFAMFSTNVEKNADIFKVGIKTNEVEGFKSSQYEDPMYWGFTIDIDAPNESGDIPNANQNYNTSPFFNKAYNGKGLGQFLDVYSQYIPEIASRIPIYTKLHEAITEIFKSNHTGGDTNSAYKNGFRSKNHYIYSVSNLKILHKHGLNSEVMGKNDENFIELSMFEDTRMSATYLASLYNTLIWSNVNHKMLIPKNLLYFKTYLKFSEVRNMTSVRLLVKEIKAGKYVGVELERAIELIKRNTSSVIYTLHDCYFDFKESDSWGDEIVIGGWGAGPVRSTDMKFKIRFNSFTKVLNPTLIDSSFGFDDSLIDLGLKTYEGVNDETGKIATAIKTTRTVNNKPQESTKYIGIDKSSPIWTHFYNKEKDLSTDLTQHNLKHQALIMNNTFTRGSKYLTSTQGSVNDIYSKDSQTASDKTATDLLQTTKNIRVKDGLNRSFNQNQDDIAYRQFLEDLKISYRSNSPYSINEIGGVSQLRDTKSVQEFFNNQGTKLKSTVKNATEAFLSRLKDQTNIKRAELLSNLIYKVRTKTGVSQMDSPTNVYKHNGIIRQYLSAIGNSVGNDIINYTRSFVTKLFS